VAAYSEGIPVARIAREASVSRPTVYAYLQGSVTDLQAAELGFVGLIEASSACSRRGGRRVLAARVRDARRLARALARARRRSRSRTLWSRLRARPGWACSACRVT